MSEGRMSVPYTERFAQVPQWWLDHYAPQATDLQFRVYVAARSYAYGHKQSAWPSNGTLADQCGCYVRSVPRIFEYWEQQGVLVRKPFYRDNGKRMPNKIIFVIPEKMQTDDPTMSPGTGSPCQRGHGDHVTGDTRIRQDKADKPKQTRQDGRVRSSRFDVDDKTLESVASTFEIHVGREPFQTEREHLAALIERWGKNDVCCAISEYSAQAEGQTIRSQTRYIEGILKTWAREGVRLSPWERRQ